MKNYVYRLDELAQKVSQWEAKVAYLVAKLIGRVASYLLVEDVWIILNDPQTLFCSLLTFCPLFHLFMRLRLLLAHLMLKNARAEKISSFL